MNEMMKNGGAAAPATRQPNLADMINSDAMKAQWAVVLPKCLTADRLARVALTQLRKNPKLGQCTQQSFLGSLMTCAEVGLEPNGRHAHLIPYGQECQLIIDYKGLVELAMRSGKISRIHADVVCRNDKISIKNGIISHEIDPQEERGEVIGAYSMCAFTDCTERHEYMSKAEIEAIRNRSRAGKSGPWVTDFNEMAKKTVFRRMAKWLPLSPEVYEASDADGDMVTVTGTASAPVYMAPPAVASAPFGEHPDLVPAPDPVRHPDEALDGSPKPVRDLPQVDVMTKEQLLEELSGYSRTEAYTAALDKFIPPECTTRQAGASVLREMVTQIRDSLK